MPLRVASASLVSSRYAAVVAVPAFNARATIERTLASAAASIAEYRRRGGRPVAISVVDDASSDGTAAVVAAFGERCDEDVFLTVRTANGGRARARNLAVAAVASDCCLFLDHDDHYDVGHVSTCLEALDAHPAADFVKTGVRLSDPVHPDWVPRIAASLTQNLCVRARVHRLVGGFQEEPVVEAYGCDDQLYNRTLRACFPGVEIAAPTVTFVRRLGNSFDRQYDRKFTRPEAEAENTLTPEQRRLQPLIRAMHDRRLADVHVRLARLEALRRPFGAHRRARPAEEPVRLLDTPRPFADDGDRIYAVMVTGKGPERGALANASVRSFLRQDHPNRALVVVNDGPYDVDVSGVPPTRRILARPTGRRTLGELRNIGLDAVPEGALWTYWDDDDWHHPRLLAEQRAALVRMGVPACFLAHQIKYGVAQDVAVADYHPGGFAGTLLAVKHGGLRFPAVGAGEDSAFTAALKERWPWTVWRNPAHYFVRFFHGANTWPADHFGLGGEAPGRWHVPRAAAVCLRAILPAYREAFP
ncbi:MAG: glycosyltransferase [Vicinamibacterales bacterium]